ncbi:hypothetical protein [Nonomuraea sp. NPDC050643]
MTVRDDGRLCPEPAIETCDQRSRHRPGGSVSRTPSGEWPGRAA